MATSLLFRMFLRTSLSSCTWLGVRMVNRIPNLVIKAEMEEMEIFSSYTLTTIWDLGRMVANLLEGVTAFNIIQDKVPHHG